MAKNKKEWCMRILCVFWRAWGDVDVVCVKDCLRIHDSEWEEKEKN